MEIEKLKTHFSQENLLEASNSKLKTIIFKYLPYILLSLILILGAYLRLYRISDYMTFLGDEGRDVLVVKRMIVDYKFTLLGPTASVGGFFLGPIYYYFMIPFLWLFNFNPVGPAVMVALFGIATIFLVYLLGKVFFDQTGGLIAALLYALSPVVINYSHSSWNPNLVPFFASLLILILYRVGFLEKRKETFWIGVVIGIGLQLHYLFLFLAAVTFLYLVTLRLQLSLKQLGFLILGFLISYSPFLLFELRHGFPNTQMIFRFVLTGNDTGFDLVHFLETLKEVIWRLFFRLVAENKVLGATLSLAMGSLGLWQVKEKKPLRLFFLWLIVPLFLFGLYKKPIYDYYFGIIFPLPFLLTGAGISYLGKINKLFAVASFLIVFYLAIINWQARPFIYEPNRQLLQTEKVARFILEKASGKPFNFALITGQNSDHAYRYFLEILGNKPVVIENPFNDPKKTTVTNQLFVICEVTDCQPLGNSLWDVAGFGRAEIEGHWKVTVLDVYKLIHYKETT